MYSASPSKIILVNTSNTCQKIKISTRSFTGKTATINLFIIESLTQLIGKINTNALK